MKTYISNICSSTLLLFLLIGAFSCRKKAPEGFSAEFEVSYHNGGMAPDTVQLHAQYPDADTYEWTVEGNTFYGLETSFPFSSEGDYTVELRVESGRHIKTKSTSIPIQNYPVGGSAMTVVQEDGVIGSLGVGGDHPFFYPIDTLDSGDIAGMDYDDNSKELFYTGSIIRAFPNGAEKTVIFSDEELFPDEEITDLVVDSEDKRVYFSIKGSFAQSIASIDEQGGDLDFLFELSLGDTIRHITLDEDRDRVYFTTDFFSSIFYTFQGEYATLLNDQFTKDALVFDHSTKYLYYAEFSFTTQVPPTSYILRVKPDSYNPDVPDTWPQLIVENASVVPIHGLDISEKNQILYWADSDENIIYSLDLNEPNAERQIVIKDILNPRALAIGDF